MKLSTTQRSTLLKLRRCQRNRGGALPESWPFWGKYDPRTIKALERGGLLVRAGGFVAVDTRQKVRAAGAGR